jgi:uncharacterized Ntn-hydrolase superfamily protein
MLSLLEDGVEVSAAIAAVVQSTPHFGFRQLGLIDCHGDTGLEKPGRCIRPVC